MVASLALALFKGQKSTMYAFILRVFSTPPAWQHESIWWKWIASAAFGRSIFRVLRVNLECCGSSSCDGMILFSRPTADADGANYLAIALQGNATGKNHDLAIV
jgi:hypothetical protein